MRSSPRLYAFFLVLSALLAATVVLGGNGGASSDGDALPPRASVNLIAYTSLQGQIITMRPDGSYPEKVSPNDGFFTWPMWSPDGNQLVFSGVQPGSVGMGPLALYHYRLGQDQPRVLYTNEPGMGPILGGMPHYPLWAPDSGRLVFMASDPRGLTLFLTDPRNGDGARVVIRRAPLYASWSSDSRQLLVHGGPDHFLADVTEEVKVKDLGVRAASYRVPAWWPLSKRIAFISENDVGSLGLYISHVDSGHRTLLQGLLGSAAFLGSPDGRFLAVGHSGSRRDFGYQGVALFSPDGTRRSVGIDEDVIAFFWSPDSHKLAYVTPSGTRNVLRWMVLNVENEERWPLVDFTPSADQMTIFQFFDQFAYSHSLWSPNSDSLVFAGVLSGEGVSASLNSQQAPQIFVVDAGPSPVAEPIADGILAVWSPR